MMFINSCLKHPLIKRAIMTSFADNKLVEPNRAGNDTNFNSGAPPVREARAWTEPHS